MSTTPQTERVWYSPAVRVLMRELGIDPATVTASIADGVLTIHVPLPEARKPRRIQITTGHQQPAIASNPNWEELEAQVSENSHVEEPGLAGTAS